MPAKQNHLKHVYFSDDRSSFASIDTEESINDSNDNVTVCVRVRKLLRQEKNRNDKNVVEHLSPNAILIDNGSSNPFTFNAVFDEGCDQADFFSSCGVTRLLDKALDGFACTVFAYGPTGSGKTHTITGPYTLFNGTGGDSTQYGLIQRSFQYLFDRINSSNAFNCVLRVSYLEVYNEKVKDLLNPSTRDSLKVRWTRNKGFHVENLFTVECETIEDILIILEEGVRHRQMGVSNSNEHSSRSHCLLLTEIMIETVSREDQTMYLHKNGMLTFVDLAGSEKLHQGSEGNLAETTNINKSLLALGNCISCLSDSHKRNGHIPYRESKLTQLLADSLGGNGITLMIACVSPSSFAMTESLNTLRYANRAKKIKNKPFVIVDPNEKEIVALRREVAALRGENQYLRTQLNVPKEQTFTELAKKSAKLRKSKEETTAPVEFPEDGSLYEMVQAYMIENESLRKDTAELGHWKEKLSRQYQEVSQENHRLQRKLDEMEALVSQALSSSNNKLQVNNHHTPPAKPNNLPPLTSPRSQPSNSFKSNTLNSNPVNGTTERVRKKSSPVQINENIGLQKSHSVPTVTDERKKPARKTSQHRPSLDSNYLTEINEKLLKDIKNLDTEIQQYQKKVKST